MKTIYLIRHSAPFVEIENYEDYRNAPWSEYNKNMILSVAGEENAKKLCNVEELKSIDEIYASNSFRAIGTAKYIAEQNHLKIIIDNRINERELGVEKIMDLPDQFTQESFHNKDLKIGNGESLSEVDKRFNHFLGDILKTDKSHIGLFIHGILLMSFLQNNTHFEYDDYRMRVIFHDEVVYDDRMRNPQIFKVVFNDQNQIIDIKNIPV